MALTLRRFLSVGLVSSFGMTAAGVAGATGSSSPPGAVRPAEATALAPGARTLQVAQKTGGRQSRGKRGSAPKEAAGATEKAASPAPASKGETTPAPASADGPELKFSRDIAPILVANCIGCHNPQRRRGKFDLTTFEKFMTGAEKEKVIVPGKPDESPLVLRIKGEQTPKMPPGDQNLADTTVSKIERWVQGGAVLDAGTSRTATLASYAPSPDQIRKAELAKLPASERDKQAEAVGRERWKKADPKGAPEVTPSAHFLLFGNLPKARAAATLRGVESQFGPLKALLSRPGTPALAWDEKISLYLFRDNARFTEFVRTVEGHEVEQGDQVAVNLAVPQPYIAAVDPLGGRDEPAAAKRGPRSKRGASPAGGGRGLVGLIVEPFVAAAVAREGNPPRWLSLGLGAFFAAHAERRSPTAARLRRDAYALFEQGWAPKATEAMGGATKLEDIRAVGFALCEWMAAEARPSFPAFVRGMLEGQEKLDDVIRKVLDGSRDEFLAGSGEWIAANYGPDP